MNLKNTLLTLLILATGTFTATACYRSVPDNTDNKVRSCSTTCTIDIPPSLDCIGTCYRSVVTGGTKCAVVTAGTGAGWTNCTATTSVGGGTFETYNGNCSFTPLCGCSIPSTPTSTGKTDVVIVSLTGPRC